jgi:hypothetical protein
VLVFLSFFTSIESQQTLAPHLAPETRAYELSRIWFDDVFVPGIRYLEGIKGDRDENASTEFKSYFTEEEWKYIERFHRFLELRIDMIPESYRRKRQLPGNNLWESIVRDAAYLLELLEPDPQKRRRLLDSEQIPALSRCLPG